MWLIRASSFQACRFTAANIKAEDKCTIPLAPVSCCLQRCRSSIRIRASTDKGFRVHGVVGTRGKTGLVCAVRRGYPRRKQAGSADTEFDPALDVPGLQAPEVRLIDEQQQMVGIVNKMKAIQMAREANLDLVIISAEANPPVVRIMDYSKFRFEQQKKKKEQQRKSRIDVKELKMGYNIGAHDYDVRLRAAKRFLKEGDKVKVMALLKGRQKDYQEDAIDLLERFISDLKEISKVERKSFEDIRNLHIVLTPNKAAIEKMETTKNASEQQPREPEKSQKQKEEPNAEISAGV